MQYHFEDKISKIHITCIRCGIIRHVANFCHNKEEEQVVDIDVEIHVEMIFGPFTEPCGTPAMISNHSLNEMLIFDPLPTNS